MRRRTWHKASILGGRGDFVGSDILYTSAPSLLPQPTRRATEDERSEDDMSGRYESFIQDEAAIVSLLTGEKIIWYLRVRRLPGKDRERTPLFVMARWFSHSFVFPFFSLSVLVYKAARPAPDESVSTIYFL
jgi:hypothetical protein